jgi:hypothetical protein
LSTYTTDDKTYVWAIPKEGEVRFAIASMGSTELTSRVVKLRLALELPGTMVSAIPAYDIEAAYALYDALLKPVEDAWRDATTILAVPFGALAQLPLGLLPVTASEWSGGSDVRYRNVPWLIRRHALAVFPSAASLVSVRQSGAASSPSRPFVGFGDPVFQGRADEGYVRTDDAARGAEPGFRDAPQLRKVSSARLETLPHCPRPQKRFEASPKRWVPTFRVMCIFGRTRARPHCRSLTIPEISRGIALSHSQPTGSYLMISTGLQSLHLL